MYEVDMILKDGWNTPACGPHERLVGLDVLPNMVGLEASPSQMIFSFWLWGHHRVEHFFRLLHCSLHFHQFSEVNERGHLRRIP